MKYDFQISEGGGSYDLILEIRVKRNFTYDELPLNMVLNTPSGEERIKEYIIQIRDKNGSLTGTLNGDTCINRLILKKNLLCSRKGLLRVEIENLNPRMETEGVFSTRFILIQR